MNTALFTEGEGNLEQVIRKWFRENPTALPPEDKEVAITFKTRDRSHVITVQSAVESSLEEIFKQGIGVLKPHVSEGIRNRLFDTLSSYSIKTIGQLCFKNRKDVSRYRNLGSKSLRELESALKKIDSRLCFDMPASAN